MEIIVTHEWDDSGYVCKRCSAMRWWNPMPECEAGRHAVHWFPQCATENCSLHPELHLPSQPMLDAACRMLLSVAEPRKHISDAAWASWESYEKPAREVSESWHQRHGTMVVTVEEWDARDLDGLVTVLIKQRDDLERESEAKDATIADLRYTIEHQIDFNSHQEMVGQFQEQVAALEAENADLRVWLDAKNETIAHLQAHVAFATGASDVVPESMRCPDEPNAGLLTLAPTDARLGGDKAR